MHTLEDADSNTEHVSKLPDTEVSMGMNTFATIVSFKEQQNTT